MVRFWNKDLKRFTFLMLMIALLGGVLCNLALSQYSKKEAKREYDLYAGMAEAILSAYPETAEEDLIKAISGKASSENGKEFLARFGILENSFTKHAEKNLSILIGEMNAILLFVAVCCGLVFLLFWKGRNARLGELCHYVDRISFGEENLDIRNNQEDELSGLKNELYKLMVSMREQAGEEKEGKAALAKAVENISHQLKTPLTSAVVLADNLLEDDNMPAEVHKRFIQEISRQLIGMKWLVVTLLKLSRLDAGVVELEKETVPMKRVLETAISNLEMNAEWKELTLKTRLTDGEILGDEKWLTEGLQNIIKNAMEFSPVKGQVEIETEDNDVFLQVIIRDHGPGISEEARKHLFERFYTASRMENENMGIGLALSKEIVEKHNGYVTVNSGSDGTEFVIRFLKHFS